MPITGDVIASKYELVRILGSGSMGDVWVAHHRSLGEDVALKLLTHAPSDVDEDPRVANARFRFEAQVAARLSRRTRHIVRVTDHGEDDGLAYLVMEMLEGETLERRMTRGRIALAETPELGAQIARALTHAHAANVIHRDLKPANVFLASDEDGRLLVKLLDFGIARTIQTHRVPASFSTGRGLVFGTPGYMSPEQVNPRAKLDRQCDLWAFATVLYEALTGESPVTGASGAELFANLAAGRVVPVHEREPGLPVGLASFFARAFARDIDERYPSATELARAFERAVESRTPAGVAPPRGAGTLRGHAVAMTLPMRSRRRRAPASSPGHAFRPSAALGRRVAIVAALGSLLGVAGAASALYARNGSSARADMAPGGSGFRLVRAADDTAIDTATPIPATLAETEERREPSPAEVPDGVAPAAPPASPSAPLPRAAVPDAGERRPPGTANPPWPQAATPRTPRTPAPTASIPASTGAPSPAPAASSVDRSAIL